MTRRPATPPSPARHAIAAAATILALLPAPAAPQFVTPAPDRAEGEGPFDRLVIRGAIVIDGTGAPPRGPVDIVIEGNRIARIAGVGYPGLPIDASRRPAPGTHEIDAHGMYVLPGFVDLHLHTGGLPKTPQAEYVYKLWMAHGVTSGRGIEYGPVDFSLSERERANSNEITAPRMFVYQRPGQGWDGGSRAHPGAGARVGPLGGRTGHRRDQVRRLSAGDHGGAPRRGRTVRHGQRGPPRPARSRADERGRRRAARTRHRHPLLRACSRRSTTTTTCSPGRPT